MHVRGHHKRVLLSTERTWAQQRSALTGKQRAQATGQDAAGNPLHTYFTAASMASAQRRSAAGAVSKRRLLWPRFRFMGGLPGSPGGDFKPTGGRSSTSRRKRRRRAAAPRGTCRARACTGSCGVGRLGIALTQAPRTEAHAREVQPMAALQEADLPSRRRIYLSANLCAICEQTTNRTSLLRCTSSGSPEQNQ